MPTPKGQKPSPQAVLLVHKAVAAGPLAGTPFYEVHLRTESDTQGVSQGLTLRFQKPEAQWLLEQMQARPPIPVGPKRGRTT